METLSKLYFGKDDAESDFSAGGLLKQGFLRTTAYKAAQSGRKTLIIGRKGSGKSAICLMLYKDKNNNGNTCLITPDEISAEEIRRFSLSGIARQESKSLIWRYIFNIQIAKYIVSSARKEYSTIAALPKEVKALRQFLIDNGEVDELTFNERFWRIIEKIHGTVSLEAFGVTVEGGVDNENIQPDGIRKDSELDVVEENINKAFGVLSTLFENKQLFLLVDQIEKVWSNDRDSDLLVIGLLTAVKRISNIFNNVLCITFLRTDIYELLQFQDRDKFRGDEIHIDWTSSHMDELILARARASLNDDIKAQELWGEMFPASVNGTAIDHYLIQRTLMRPRDIIQLCNACRDVAEKNAHEAIKISDIKEAYALYSNWKLSDLINEYRINYPFLSDIFVLFTNTGFIQKRELLRLKFDKIHNSLNSRFPEYTNLFSLDSMVEILYSIGFLGVIRNDQSTYVYDDKNVIEVEENGFIIHPCFRPALRSVASLDILPYESDLNLDDSNFIRYRHRMLGEISPIRSHSIQSRGSRGYRSLMYIEDITRKIHSSFTSVTLPEEIVSEVRNSLSEYENDLTRIRDYGLDNQVFISELTRKILRYLSSLSMSLSDRGMLDKKLVISLEESIHELERIGLGFLDEYST